MSKYKQTNITGESYVRANQITIQNPLNQNPSVVFTEEEAMNVNGEEILIPVSNCSETLTLYNEDSNLQEEVQLINPITFEEIEGATMTYEQIMTALFSLYYHVAGKRDAENQSEE